MENDNQMNSFYDPRDATYIEIDAGVRYWEDATVNGIEDTDGTLIFGQDQSAKENSWKIRINLSEGRISGWPSGTIARIYYKVCDEGVYWLTNEEGVRIAKWNGSYVPDDFLCHGETGHGDYIILTVGPDGTIAKYRPPQIDPARWAPMPTNPHKEVEG